MKKYNLGAGTLVPVLILGVGKLILVVCCYNVKLGFLANVRLFNYTSIFSEMCSCYRCGQNKNMFKTYC